VPGPDRIDLLAGIVQPFWTRWLPRKPSPSASSRRRPEAARRATRWAWLREVIAARGGTYGSVCASDPGQTLDDIVSAVAGANSTLQLTGSPIAITLKVIRHPADATCDPADPMAGR